MLNEERIRVMTNLARYKEGPGKKHLGISRYYRGDYIGMALVKNFFLVTIGYVLLLVLAAGYYLETLVQDMQSLNVSILVVEVVLGYLVLMIIYSAATYIICSVRYEIAKKSVSQYDQELGKMEKMYITEKVKNDMLKGSRRRSI